MGVLTPFFSQDASVCMDTPAANSNIMMSPEQPALSPANLPAAPLALPQRMTPDLEQAWLELWSLPELQVLNLNSFYTSALLYKGPCCITKMPRECMNCETLALGDKYVFVCRMRERVCVSHTCTARSTVIRFHY